MQNGFSIMKINFTKMHGAGNDFILIDDRALEFPINDTAFLQRICCRRTGVGSDGVILLQPSDSADVRMRMINSDGGEVDMCGNGARCLARLAHEKGAASKNMTLETGAGLVSAQVLGEQICLQLTDPVDLKLDLNTELEWPIDFVNTGVPHAVAWVSDPSRLDLLRAGKLLRQHALFAPNGTNANFAKVEADGSLTLRTYERGVEAETLACGTGAAAVAVLAAERGWVTFPAVVHCAGGYDLVIDSSREIITLKGNAEMVFEGEVYYGDRV